MTIYDEDPEALADILQEWATAHSVAMLQQPGAVGTDDDSDFVSGKNGADWFFISQEDVLAEFKEGQGDELSFIPTA